MTNIYWVRCSWNEYAKLIKNEFDEDVTYKEPGGRFEVYTKKDNDICVIWIPMKASYDVVAHEVFHCSYWILQQIGMRLTNASEESYAYLIQYILKQMKIK